MATPAVELTVREAARRVHRAEETIRRWIWAGKLHARKQGRGYLVAAGDVDALAGAVAGPGAPGLDEWIRQVGAWRAENGLPERGGAGALVLEDRERR